ncbi:hypothetical protein HPB51_024711 [Rhipicephalus microplus]|uniref:Mitochondrial import receptor subunit TOM22 homolog n=1 Tax=Rhipicephalus microplus TaxID=6941 RepID=A0A9J6EVD4_RHIMP|nr:hypothetical protein HPB51_024711 [Rhipicephalus microplus]
MSLRRQDLDETLYERLWGLTEMFPPKLRQGVYDVANFSWGSAKGLYSFGRSAFWIIFSSSAILFAPVIFELERLQMEEMSRQQQRQLPSPQAAAAARDVATNALPIHTLRMSEDSTGSKCSCVWWCTTWHDASNGSWTPTTRLKGHGLDKDTFIESQIMIAKNNGSRRTCSSKKPTSTKSGPMPSLNLPNRTTAAAICGSTSSTPTWESGHIPERRNPSDLQHFRRDHQCRALLISAAFRCHALQNIFSSKMSGGKKCSFNADWANPSVSDCASWIRPVENYPHKAMCTVCQKTFLLSNMGHRAVSSHASSKKHIAALNFLKSASQPKPLSFFKSPTDASPSSSAGSAPAATEVAVTTAPVQVSVGGFLFKNNVTKAEIFWCLNTIMAHGSFRSAVASAALFPLMFLTSEVAAKVQLGKDKVGYTIRHGIASYFCNMLLSSLVNVPYLVVRLTRR